MTDTPGTLTDDAGQTPESGDGTQPPESNQHDGTEPQDEDHDHDDPAIRKARRENAGLRKRLRDTEAERDQYRDRIEFMLQRSILTAAEANGYPAKLAELITDVETLLDDNGALDTKKLSETISSTAAEWNITRKGRAPEPNPQQGRYGPPQRLPDDEWQASFGPRPR